MLPTRTYASVLAPQLTKTAAQIRIDDAVKLQPQELLLKAQQYIEGAFAIRQIRSNDTEVFVQSVFQRDTALNMRQPNEFKTLRHYFPAVISSIHFCNRIEGGRDANNHAIIREIETITKARIPGLKLTE